MVQESQRNPWKDIPGSPRSQARTCTWCGGGGEDPHFGGSTNTCQTCAGSGMEERLKPKEK